MPLGIDPKVDFAFKLVFGSPDHTRVTIHFLNAVLNGSKVPGLVDEFTTTKRNSITPAGI
jgi:hypothetical protein